MVQVTGQLPATIVLPVVVWNQVEHGKEKNNFRKLVNRQLTVYPIALPIDIAFTNTCAVSIFDAIIRCPAVLADILFNLSKLVSVVIAFNLISTFCTKRKQNSPWSTHYLIVY